jgi:F-type H+-transporting ATPase subunit delta
LRSQEIARRYAAALYQIAAEDHAVSEMEDELAAIAVETSENIDVRRFLAHPLVPRGAKSELLLRAFPSTSERMRNFLDLVIGNRRETYLDLIYKEFTDIRATDEGRVQVTVTTAQTLSEEDRQRLLQRLEAALKHPVLLEERTDEDLLGGARIETAGRVMDGTLRARLAALRMQLGDRGTK